MSKIKPYTIEEHKPLAEMLIKIEAEVSTLCQSLNRDGHRIPVKYVDRILKLGRELHEMKCEFRSELERNHQITEAQDWYFPRERQQT